MKKIDYTGDIVAFFRDMYPLPEGKPLIPPFLQEWLYTVFPLPAGDPAARTVLDSRSKKQGKSATAGLVALYMASRRRYSEVVICAADKDQAKDRVFRSLRYAVEYGPLAKSARVYRDIIELDNGSFIQALPYDWKGASGGNQNCVIFDELHTYTFENQRRIFDEMVIPPTQEHGVRWIASYAGFLNESDLLLEIWTRALAGERLDKELPTYLHEESSLLAVIDQGQDSWRMPWTTREYMDTVQASERPNTFRRLWLNEWVANESRFVDREAWEACYDPELKPLAPDDRRLLVFGADASTRRDLTALVGLTWNDSTSTADVVYCRVWKPQPGHDGKMSINLTGLRDELLRLDKKYIVQGVLYDPYQLHQVSQELRDAKLRMIEHAQTNARTESDQFLYDAIMSHKIRHYNDHVLNEHINNAVSIESVRGMRLAKERTSLKIDAAVALSMGHSQAELLCRPRRIMW